MKANDGPLTVPDSVHEYKTGHGANDTWVVTVFDNASPSMEKIFSETRALTREKARARAILISAAPDLYDALRDLLPLVESLDTQKELDDLPIPEIDRARLALAKAVPQ